MKARPARHDKLMDAALRHRETALPTRLGMVLNACGSGLVPASEISSARFRKNAARRVCREKRGEFFRNMPFNFASVHKGKASAYHDRLLGLVGLSPNLSHVSKASVHDKTLGWKYPPFAKVLDDL